MSDGADAEEVLSELFCMPVFTQEKEPNVKMLPIKIKPLLGNEMF